MQWWVPVVTVQWCVPAVTVRGPLLFCGREQIVGGGADGSAVEGFSVSLRPGMLGFL